MIQNGIRMLDKNGELVKTTIADTGEEVEEPEEPDAEDTGEKGLITARSASRTD